MEAKGFQNQKIKSQIEERQMKKTTTTGKTGSTTTNNNKAKSTMYWLDDPAIEKKYSGVPGIYKIRFTPVPYSAKDLEKTPSYNGQSHDLANRIINYHKHYFSTGKICGEIMDKEKGTPVSPNAQHLYTIAKDIYGGNALGHYCVEFIRTIPEEVDAIEHQAIVGDSPHFNHQFKYDDFIVNEYNPNSSTDTSSTTKTTRRSRKSVSRKSGTLSDLEAKVGITNESSNLKKSAPSKATAKKEASKTSKIVGSNNNYQNRFVIKNVGKDRTTIDVTMGEKMSDKRKVESKIREVMKFVNADGSSNMELDTGSGKRGKFIREVDIKNVCFPVMANMLFDRIDATNPSTGKTRKTTVIKGTPYVVEKTMNNPKKKIEGDNSRFVYDLLTHVPVNKSYRSQNLH